MKPPQCIYRWTATTWLAAAVAHLAWFVLELRDQPPTDEVYTRLLSFQIAAFYFTRLPYWLGALLIILIAEFAVFGRARRSSGR